MGTGPGWTDEERVALCKAYLTTLQDPVKGADQSGPTFWNAVVSAWKGLLAGRPGVRRRTERGVGSVQKQCDNIRKGVNEFGSQYLAVKRMELTGNPSEEDMISAAMARFCGAIVYKAMRKDRAADMAKGKTTKRKAKQVHCPWVPCWRVLRHVDKFSGAAGAAAADGGAAGAGSSGGSPGGRSTSDSDDDAEDAGAGGYQSRPRGSKTAKRDKAEDIQASRMLNASTDALSALARAASERTTVAFFNSAEMRDTPEAVAFRRAHARKLMAAAGLDVSPPGTLSSLAGTAAASTPATGADVPAEGGATPSTPALTSTSTPRTPPALAPAQAPAAGAALVPAFPPAASSTGPEPPARAVMEAAASTSAPPASADGSGAASRGRRSLMTKQAKAAAALAAASKTLDDETDGVYVVPVFNMRDSCAGHVEDKDEAEGDDSSDDKTNAEYQ